MKIQNWVFKDLIRIFQGLIEFFLGLNYKENNDFEVNLCFNKKKFKVWRSNCNFKESIWLNQGLNCINIEV